MIPFSEDKSKMAHPVTNPLCILITPGKWFLRNIVGKGENADNKHFSFYNNVSFSVIDRNCHLFLFEFIVCKYI